SIQGAILASYFNRSFRRARLRILLSRLPPGSLTRMLSFAASALVTALTPFAVLPTAIAISGEDGWASVAVGAAIGTIRATSIGLGWTVSGPVEVAVLGSDARIQRYMHSLSSRLLVAPLCLAACMLVAGNVGPNSSVAALSALGGALAGFTPVWFFVGTGDAVRALM